MNQPSRPELSPAIQALYCLAIAISAPFILFPAVRMLPYAKLGIGVVVTAMSSSSFVEECETAT